ncbi:hypothetical protein H0H87_012893 [Tephrocybe sp. NHM501043]|nr:hypothetical protein H0H87_012893 [Tephrocybe sp. NHM501043]
MAVQTPTVDSGLNVHYLSRNHKPGGDPNVRGAKSRHCPACTPKDGAPWPGIVMQAEHQEEDYNLSKNEMDDSNKEYCLMSPGGMLGVHPGKGGTGTGMGSFALE